MLLVGLAIATAWAMLLGTAYVAHVRLRMRRSLSVASVAGCYLILIIATLFIVGFDGSGALAAAGLIVTALVASALVMLPRAPGA